MSPAEGFDPVLEYVRLLSDFRRPWMIAGGWAIDLFLRRVTREHQDVDVAILRADQREFRTYLRGSEFDVIVGGRPEPWRAGEWLDPPSHEVHGHRSEGGPREIEILWNESTRDDWVFRRDRRITRPLSKALCRTHDAEQLVRVYSRTPPVRSEVRPFEPPATREWRRIPLRIPDQSCPVDL
jgi:hypothetical protein